MKSQKVRVFWNVAAAYVGWFLVVGSAARGMAWLGLLVVLTLLLVHVTLAERRTTEIGQLFVALVVGLAWENVAVALGVIAFPQASLRMGWAPAWIVGLWLLFATTWGGSLRWLASKPLVASFLGALLGPLSYWAGVRMGAAAFPDPVASLVLLALAWAAMLPAVLVLTERLHRRMEEPAPVQLR